MGLIILEGPDGAGKTSLAEALVSDDAPYGVTKLIHTAQPTHQLGAYHEYLTELIVMHSRHRDADTLRVYDRFHLGELVYGPVFRGGSALSEREARLIDMLLDKMGAMRVILDAPDDVLLSRAFDRGEGEDFVDREQLLGIAGHYRQLVKRDGFSWGQYNTSLYKADELARVIWREVRERDVRRLITSA